MFKLNKNEKLQMFKIKIAIFRMGIANRTCSTYEREPAGQMPTETGILVEPPSGIECTPARSPEKVGGK